MFYKAKVTDHIRVPPAMFNVGKRDAVLANITKSYENYISKELGFVVNVIDVEDIEEGIIVPGDGAGYYQATFSLLTYKPELNEVVYAKVRDITDFGAFMLIGAIEGLTHVSQSMDDFVSFSKDKVLQGKKTGKVLKVNDRCKARIIAVSYKDITNPKIGLTMRQEGLGKLDWTGNEFPESVGDVEFEEPEKLDVQLEEHPEQADGVIEEAKPEQAEESPEETTEEETAEETSKAEEKEETTEEVEEKEEE
tara:strand:- start:2069 stop:2821 length:753 start_codon:yes stop_codon:yes gene_type:complete